MIDDGVHGLLVEPRDPHALADALQRVLTDAALHRSLALGGRARICERFDSRRTTRRAARPVPGAAAAGQPAPAQRGGGRGGS